MFINWTYRTNTCFTLMKRMKGREGATILIWIRIPYENSWNQFMPTRHLKDHLEETWNWSFPAGESKNRGCMIDCESAKSERKRTRPYMLSRESQPCGLCLTEQNCLRHRRTFHDTRPAWSQHVTYTRTKMAMQIPTCRTQATTIMRSELGQVHFDLQERVG